MSRRNGGDDARMARAAELIPYEEAHGAAAPVLRLKAHALTVVLAVVPATFALFCAVSRRLDIADGVVVQRRPTPSLREHWDHYVFDVQPHDPFAPRRAAGSSASVLTLRDLDRGEVPSVYVDYLEELGVGDVATVYLRSAGALVGAVTLLRARDEAAFEGPEVVMLRRLHPLLEHAYVYAQEPVSHAASPDPLAAAGLTPREVEVAQLIGTGSTNAEIARALHMSLATVKTHLTQIYTKLGLRSRTQLAILLGSDPGARDHAD